MRIRRHIRQTLALSLLAPAFLVTSAAHATPGDGGFCWPVRAEIDASWAIEGCDSPLGLCTAGTIKNRGGFVQSSTAFTATGLGGEPVGEVSIVTPPAEPASTWAYSGVLVLENMFGSLTIEDVGVFDTANGLFSEVWRVAGGTGFFANVTGHMFAYGQATATGFGGDIRGELCMVPDGS